MNSLRRFLNYLFDLINKLYNKIIDRDLSRMAKRDEKTHEWG